MEILIGIILIAAVINGISRARKFLSRGFFCYMLLDYVAETADPPYKLLLALIKCKLINIEWMMLAERRRKKRELSSLFNNGKGFYFECENYFESEIAIAKSINHFVDKEEGIAS